MRANWLRRLLRWFSSEPPCPLAEPGLVRAACEVPSLGEALDPEPERHTFLGSPIAEDFDDALYETLDVERSTGGLIRRRVRLSAYLAGETMMPCPHRWRPYVPDQPAGRGPYLCDRCGAELSLPPR